MLWFDPAQGTCAAPAAGMVPPDGVTDVPGICPAGHWGRLPTPMRIGARVNPWKLKRQSSLPPLPSAVGFGAPVRAAPSAAPMELVAGSATVLRGQAPGERCHGRHGRRGCGHRGRGSGAAGGSGRRRSGRRVVGEGRGRNQQGRRPQHEPEGIHTHGPPCRTSRRPWLKQKTRRARALWCAAPWPRRDYSDW